MDERGHRKGPQSGLHLLLSPGAAQTAARLPPVQPGGRDPVGGLHLQGEVRRGPEGVRTALEEFRPVCARRPHPFSQP